MVRSLHEEAAPVLCETIDDALIGRVFGADARNEAVLAKLNPYIELCAARRLRDQVAHRFAVKPGRLIGQPEAQLARSARAALVAELAQRGWARAYIEAYLGTVLEDEAAAGLA